MKRLVHAAVIASMLLVPVSLRAQDSSAKSGRLPHHGDLEEIPEWYVNHQPEDHFLVATGTATSADLQVASDKAKLSARREIATQLEARMRSFEKKVTEEEKLQEDNRFQQNYKSAMVLELDQVLRNTRVRKQEVKREEGQFRVYLLVEMPIGPVGEDLIKKIKGNSALYAKVKESKAWAELISAGLNAPDLAGKDSGTK